MSATRPRRSTRIRPRIGSGWPRAWPGWHHRSARSRALCPADRPTRDALFSSGSPRAEPEQRDAARLELVALAPVAGDGARGARGARGPRRAAGASAQSADASAGRCWREPRRCSPDRLEDAAAALEAPALDADPESRCGGRRSLRRVRTGRRARASSPGRETVLAGYPPALQVRLGLPAAQAASEAGDHELAGEVLERSRSST